MLYMFYEGNVGLLQGDLSKKDKDKPAVIDLINSPSPAKNAIFVPRPILRAPTLQVPTTQNDIFMPRPHALTHQVTAT